MSQRICVISFDHWNYDCHIVAKLKNLNHNAHHIKIHGFKHANLKDKIANLLSKVFLGKNLKKIKRQEYVLKRLKALGKQDQILVINPDVLDLKYHKEIKKMCSKYIAYLYDSMDRNPIHHLLNGIFNAIYSFDKNDIKNYNFIETSNYIYLPKVDTLTETVYNAVYIGSCDDRIPELVTIAKILKKENISFYFSVIGKQKQIALYKDLYSEFLNFSTKKLSQKELIAFYKTSQVIIDLVRDKQTGLSFRFFEALALNKKVITNNKKVKDYNFYNTQNIFILNEDRVLDISFFKSKYVALENETYNAFTLDSWVKNIFKL